MGQTSVSADMKGGLRTARKQAINTEQRIETPTKSDGTDSQLVVEHLQ